ncbi:MAG: hypothetical protein ACJAVZ_005174 [Afipia broomeae]|jgi:hypothetical protein
MRAVIRCQDVESAQQSSLLCWKWKNDAKSTDAMRFLVIARSVATKQSSRRVMMIYLDHFAALSMTQRDQSQTKMPGTSPGILMNRNE